MIKTDYWSSLRLPHHWHNEQGGELAQAVWAYIEHHTKGAPEPPQDQLSLLRDYLAYYIFAPCWSEHELGELEDLRWRVAGLETPEEIDRWIMDCLAIGIDPL